MPHRLRRGSLSFIASFPFHSDFLKNLPNSLCLKSRGSETLLKRSGPSAKRSSFGSLDRRYHEYERIPEHVRDNHRDKASCGPVEAPPEKAAGEGCKDEHRIPCRKMDRGVKKGSEEESGPGAPSPSEASLHKASPEDFLSEPYGEKEQKGDKGRGKPSEVRVNRSDVARRVGEESRKESGYKHEKLVSHVENSIQQSSKKNSEKNLLCGELSARNDRPA